MKIANMDELFIKPVALSAGRIFQQVQYAPMKSDSKDVRL
jgi:hypothetical protein